MKTRKNKNHQDDCIKKLNEIKAGNKHLVKLISSVLHRERCKKLKLQLEHLDFEIKLVTSKPEKNKLEQRIKELIKSYEKPKDLDIPEPSKQLNNLNNTNHINKSKYNNSHLQKQLDKTKDKDVSYMGDSTTDKLDKKDKDKSNNANLKKNNNAFKMGNTNVSNNHKYWIFVEKR